MQDNCDHKSVFCQKRPPPPLRTVTIYHQRSLRGSAWGEGNAGAAAYGARTAGHETGVTANYRDMSQIAVASKLESLARRKGMIATAQQQHQ
ncbi:unnamed protein product [Laminaria digitata]